MLRIVTSLIRNAPGPLRGPRALAADLVEGLIDIVSPPPEVVPPPPPPPRPAEVSPQAPPAPAPAAAAKPEPKKAAAAEKPAEEPQKEVKGASEDLLGDFKTSTSRPDLVRRQDFKVLAIFWESRRRGNGPLTAKKAAALGGELEMTIRHENVRKVVRTRLTDQIQTSTVANSQPPTFEYELTDDGAAFFETEFLAKL